MARFLRLEDIKLKPRVSIQHPAKLNKYYCERCNRYHLIYSNIGNKHRDYKSKRRIETMASDYTPAPQIQKGEIIANNGKRALVVQYLQNGEIRLCLYEWKEDKRYNTPKGDWEVPIFGTIYLTLAERKALSGVFN